jgi:signal transduction histidine kinase
MQPRFPPLHDPQSAASAVSKATTEHPSSDRAVGLANGPEKIVRACVDVTELLAVIVRDAASKAEASGRKVTLLATEPFVSLVGAERVSQALARITSDALEFTAQGTEILITACPERSQLSIIIEDRRPALPADLLGEIFAPFVRRDTQSLMKIP